MLNKNQEFANPRAESGVAFAVRLAVFYGVVFLLIGGFLPYFAVWLDGRGLGPSEIAIIVAAPLFVRVFITPVISFVADRLGDRRLVLILLAWGTLLASLTFTQVAQFWTMLIASTFFALFWTSIMPLAEAMAMRGVREGGLDYGRMRLWGSLTFIIATTGAGLAIQRWGSEAALATFISAAVAIVLGAHFLPRNTKRRPSRNRAITPIRVADAVMLVRSPQFLLFLLATSAVQAGHAVYYVFGSLHWQSLGISTGIIGLLWAVGVIAEVVLFTRSGHIISAYGPLRLIWLAALAAVVRWTATAFDPSLAVLFPVQLLHALTFGAAHLGAVHFISEAVPEECAGTAQGLYASVTAGVAMGAAMMASGPLYQAWGGQAYLAMGGLGIVAFVATTILMRSWQGERLIAPPTD